MNELVITTLPWQAGLPWPSARARTVAELSLSDAWLFVPHASVASVKGVDLENTQCLWLGWLANMTGLGVVLFRIPALCVDAESSAAPHGSHCKQTVVLTSLVGHSLAHVMLEQHSLCRMKG